MADDPISEPATPKRRSPWVRRLIYVALLVILGLLAWGGYDFLTSDRDLREAIAEADRLDPGWQLDDLESKRATLPAAENSATCILKVKDLLETSTAGDSAKERERLFNLWSDLSAIPPETVLTQEQSGELESMLRKAEAALKQAMRLGNMPRGKYEVRWQLFVANTPLPSQSAREAVNLLQKDAWLLSQRGQADAALEHVVSIVNAGRSVGDEPGTISQLIRMAAQSVAVHTCERALAQGTPSDAALAKAEKVLLEETKDPLTLYAMRGERAHFYRFLEAIKKGETSFSAAAGALAPGGSSANAWQSFSERIEARRTEAPGVRVLTQLVEIAKLPVEQQVPEMKKLQASAGNLPILVSLQLPAQAKIFEAFVRVQAWLRTAAVGVAVERYRLANGRWPETLADVVKARLIEQIPTDPYNGEPVRYRRLKDGAVVYCVGPDGQDDGGLINRKGDPTKAGFDLGFQLWNVDKRRQPPPPKPAEEEK
jgi:hypothetical protein